MWRVKTLWFLSREGKISKLVFMGEGWVNDCSWKAESSTVDLYVCHSLHLDFLVPILPTQKTTTPIWWGISFTLSVDHTTKYSHDFFAFSSWHFKWWGACPSALRGIQSLHPSGLQDYSGIPVVVLNYTVTNSSKDAAKVNYFVMTKLSHYILCLGCSTEQGLTVHYTYWL